MKPKPLFLLLLFFTAALTDCQKQYQNPNPVISAWQQVSERLYQTDSNPALRYDTTFHPQFTSNDNIQLYSDGTVVIASDYQFFPPTPYYPVNPKPQHGSQNKMNWTKLITGAYVFSALPYNGLPSPTFLPPSADTAFILHGDTLLYQSIGFARSPTAETVSVGCYVKK